MPSWLRACGTTRMLPGACSRVSGMEYVGQCANSNSTSPPCSIPDFDEIVLAHFQRMSPLLLPYVPDGMSDNEFRAALGWRDGQPRSEFKTYLKHTVRLYAAITQVSSGGLGGGRGRRLSFNYAHPCQVDPLDGSPNPHGLFFVLRSLEGELAASLPCLR